MEARFILLGGLLIVLSIITGGLTGHRLNLGILRIPRILWTANHPESQLAIFPTYSKVPKSNSQTNVPPMQIPDGTEMVCKNVRTNELIFFAGKQEVLKPSPVFEPKFTIQPSGPPVYPPNFIPEVSPHPPIFPPNFIPIKIVPSDPSLYPPNFVPGVLIPGKPLYPGKQEDNNKTPEKTNPTSTTSPHVDTVTTDNPKTTETSKPPVEVTTASPTTTTKAPVNYGVGVIDIRMGDDN